MPTVIGAKTAGLASTGAPGIGMPVLGALSDRCGIGRSLLKLLITPEIANSADMEAICAGGLRPVCHAPPAAGHPAARSIING